MLTTRQITPRWRINPFPTQYGIRGYKKRIIPNQGIIDMLKQHQAMEKDKPDASTYKINAFSRAIASISKLEHPITSVQDTVSLPRMGPGVQGRILAYLNGEEWNSELHRRLAAHDAAAEAIKIFQGLRGVRAPLARKLVKAGCTSVEQLLQPEFSALVPDIVRADLNFHEHWENKVTREQSERIQAILSHTFPDHEIHMTGPFRREQFDDCEKLHFVIVSPTLGPAPGPVWKTESTLMSLGPIEALVEMSEMLEDRGISAGCIGMGIRTRGMCHWEGWARIPGVREGGGFENVLSRREGCESRTGEFRLMRIVLVGKHATGAGLLTTTGDDEYLKFLDKEARQRGMFLTPDGLWSWVYPDPPPEGSPVQPLPPKGTEGNFELLPSHSEEVILEALGQPWIPPSERNFTDLVPKRPRGRTKSKDREEQPKQPKRRRRTKQEIQEAQQTPPTRPTPPLYSEETLKEWVEGS